MKTRFPGFEAGQQLEIEPLDERVLQQDLLFAPQILDIERRLDAAGEARAEIFRIEVVSAGDLDIADPAFDNAKGNHAVDDVLVRDHYARVDVTAIYVEQSQLPANFFEVPGGYRLAQVGFDNAADRRCVEDRVAGDRDIAEDKARAPRERCTFGWLRWQRHRQTRRRGWARLNRRQLRGGAPARFGDHLGGRLRSKAGQETCGQSGNGAEVPECSQQTAAGTRSGMLDRADRPLHSRPPLKQT